MKKIRKIIFVSILLTVGALLWSYVDKKTHINFQFYKTDLPEKFSKSDYFNKYDLSNHFVIYVDFRKSRNKRRLWVVDHGKVLATSYTSHGKNSNATSNKYLKNFIPPSKFSNVNNSYQSSLGIFEIGTYIKMGPKHDCSCKAFKKCNDCSHLRMAFLLDGLQSSNNNALKREILIHTSSYVSENLSGDSQGCFVVSPEVFELLQNTKCLPWEKWYLLAIQ
jgi:hypothetical protein